jgi:hypothetical protein
MSTLERAEQPQRIQLRRAKGWRLPEGAVVVSRPSRWGNPCKVGGAVDREYASAAYSSWIEGDRIGAEIYGTPPTISEIRAALAGKDLACWCDHKGHCHADILLHLANAPSDDAAHALLRKWRVFGPYTG